MVTNQTETESEILAIIYSQDAEQKPPLMMTKSYRGLLFSHDIKTVAVNAHRAVFQALDLDCCAAIRGLCPLAQQRLAESGQGAREGSFCP